MKHRITFPQHGVEGEMTVYDQKGNKMDIVIGSVEWEPYFFSSTAQPVVNFQTVANQKGEVVGRYAQAISGKTASVVTLNRTKRTKPQYESDKTTVAVEEVVEEDDAPTELPVAKPAPAPRVTPPDMTALPFDGPTQPAIRSNRVERKPAPGAPPA